MSEEAGKPRSSDRGTVTERHTDTVEAHNDALFRAWCRAVGLSESETARIMCETAVEEQVAVKKKRAKNNGSTSNGQNCSFR